MTLRVVIVDDNPRFLKAARQLLVGQGLDVVGTASSLHDALLVVEARRPDVVVTDLHLGSASGLELAGRLATQGPSAPAVVLISSVSSEDLASIAGGAPVRGYLTKLDLNATAVTTLVERVGA